MKFKSTRSQSQSPSVGIREALVQGLAPDGGLYLPEFFPAFNFRDFDNKKTIAEVAHQILLPFFAEDLVLAKALSSICERTFNFPIPLTSVKNSNDQILELFHGPTAAFKDVGARFLAECMELIYRDVSAHDSKKRTVIVATSGDTGGAVAAAFHDKTSTDVVILYPKGKVSPRQEAQLCTWGKRVSAFAVEGTFDDCQKIVKEALIDQNAPRVWLSANSINLGRILPQMVYYAHTALHLVRSKNLNRDQFPGFIIPSGNLGNSLAALWAKKMGLPIGPIHLALNANASVIEYLKTGSFQPHSSITTLANAMDVGNPSNLERLKQLYLTHSELQQDVSASSISDENIKNEIQLSLKEYGQVLCPHGATASAARKLISGNLRTWIWVATAHPAKFETIVEPLVGSSIEVPPALANILKKPMISKTIQPSYSELLGELK